METKELPEEKLKIKSWVMITCERTMPICDKVDIMYFHFGIIPEENNNVLKRYTLAVKMKRAQKFITIHWNF